MGPVEAGCFGVRGRRAAPLWLERSQPLSVKNGVFHHAVGGRGRGGRGRWMCCPRSRLLLARWALALRKPGISSCQRAAVQLCYSMPCRSGQKVKLTARPRLETRKGAKKNNAARQSEAGRIVAGLVACGLIAKIPHRSVHLIAHHRRLPHL